MARPLMRHNIAQLEELFARSKVDEKVLKQLEHELRYRQVPRAVTLLPKVQGALYGVTPPASATPTPNTGLSPGSHNPQPELWSSPRATPVATATLSVLQPPSVRIAPMASVKPVTSPAPAPAPAPKLNPTSEPATLAPTISIDDAYKVLKATPGSSWEAIEQTRRQLVQQAYPEQVASMGSEKRAQVQAEAKRVNAAYAVLCAIRVNRPQASG